MMIKAKPQDIIEHCEKYLYILNGERFVVMAGTLNNMEKALAFDYLYLVLATRAKEAGYLFFHPKAFLAMISCQVWAYADKTPEAKEQTTEEYAETIQISINKILKLRDWYIAGAPKEDIHLVNEMADMIAKSPFNDVESIFKVMQGPQAEKEGEA